MLLERLGHIRQVKTRGQALVEFALALPLFLMLLLGLIEFAFMFGATLSINFATRNASLIAAEAGDETLADCTILQQIESDVGPPQSDAQIQTVTIFQADRAGDPVAGIADVYSRGGSLSCPFTTGTVTLPYTATSSTYPYDDRCNEIQGCPVAGSPGSYVALDSIGIRIVYRYPYHTPLRNLLPVLPGAGLGYTDLTWSNVMRMEPVL